MENAKRKANKMEGMKVRIDTLLGAEMTLQNAQNRGNIPTNHAISKNLSRVMRALEPFREAQKQEPMCWHFWDELNPPKPKDKKGDAADEPQAPTDKQREEGRKALEEYLQLEVDFVPYRLRLDRCSDELGKLSKAREMLTDEQLQIINENFVLVLRDLDILIDEEE